jgi:hypothetical protein
MRTVDAFLAGYVPQVAGLYFNGLELLAEADRGADVTLAKAVGEEREKVVARRDDALAGLDRTERLLAVSGADPVPRPEDAGGYESWTEEVFEAITSSMAAYSPEAVAHLLGYVLGEAVATLDVIAILSRLRHVDPEHVWMRWQGESLEGERQTLERRLARLAAHPLLPEAVQVAAATATHAVSGAAPSGGHAARAARADEAARLVADQAVAAEAALGSAPSGPG